MNKHRVRIGVILIAFCICFGSAHDDDEVEKPAAKTTLQDRTVQLLTFEINYINTEKGKDKLDYEIKSSQTQHLFQNNFGKWIVQFYNKSNYWKFSCEKCEELNGVQKELMKTILGKESKIGDIKIDLVQNQLLYFTLIKPEYQKNSFEHSKLKNNCYKVDIYPYQIYNYAFEIRFCVDESKVAVVDKYRIILEDKQLGKKNHE